MTTDSEPPAEDRSAGSVGQRASRACAEHDWAAAFEILRGADGDDGLAPAELELLAECARFSGHADAMVEPLERAHERYVADGDRAAAARTALALCLANADQCRQALAASWWRRAGDLMTGLPESPVHALHAWFEARKCGEAGDRAGQEGAARRALELAQRHGDRNVEALALIELGHVATARGDTGAALDALDRATALALGGEIGLFESGLVFCNAILASRSRGEWDRACEWTESATRWVQRKNVDYFPGLCRVHRSEVLRVRGELKAAEYESAEAARRLRTALPRWESFAQGELGEVRRRLGDHAGAMHAFRRALELGWEPQPGMALLLLAQGDAAAAHQSLERFCGNPAPTLMCEDHTGLQAARVTVALAAGAAEVAQAAVARLGETCARGDALPWDRAAHAQARGELALHAGSLDEAVQALTEARLQWAELEAPYELATCRFLLAQALAADGDLHGGRLEAQLAAGIFTNLGATSDGRRVSDWLGQLDGGLAPAAAAAPAAPARAALRREGDVWSLTYGGRSFHLKDAVGLRYLARLLAAPEVDHWAVDLAAGSKDLGYEARRADAGDGGEVLDDEARRAYRRRLTELQEELEDARERGDEGAVEGLRTEMDTLTRHLAAALGLGGRTRRVGGAVERARQSVTKAVRGVLRRIAEQDAELGRYLHATIRTGTACRFEPDPRHPLEWDVADAD